MAQTLSFPCCTGDNSHCSVNTHCRTDGWRKKGPRTLPRTRGDEAGRRAQGHATLSHPPTTALTHGHVMGRTMASVLERFRLQLQLYQPPVLSPRTRGLAVPCLWVLICKMGRIVITLQDKYCVSNMCTQPRLRAFTLTVPSP